MCGKNPSLYDAQASASFAEREIPLYRDWSDEQYEDFERRLKEDAAHDPHYYGPAFLKALGVPWHDPQTKLTKGRPPSDRWFAETDSKTDQGRIMAAQSRRR